MSDTPPDRLSSNPKSPYYDEAVLQRGVGVRFKGVEKNNVDEYCVSEGWVRLTVGTTMDRAGRAMTIKLKGKDEPFFRDEAWRDPAVITPLQVGIAPPHWGGSSRHAWSTERDGHPCHHLSRTRPQGAFP